MRILLTAFEPFGTHKSNPTQEILNALPDKIGKVKLYKQLLPVSFAHSFETLHDRLREKSFDFIVLMGLSSQADGILLEMAAHNHAGSEKLDNDGMILQDPCIDPNAPLAYASAIPYWEALKSLQEAGYPVKVSSSAGNYVCNYIYFKCLHYIESNYLASKCVFVHMPATDDMGYDFSLPLDTEIKTITHLIEFLSDHQKLFKPLDF